MDHRPCTSPDQSGKGPGRVSLPLQAPSSKPLLLSKLTLALAIRSYSPTAFFTASISSTHTHTHTHTHIYIYIYICKYFLNLLDRHFNRDNPLRKFCYRNNVKISYTCTNNMHSIINNYNRRLLDELNRNSGGPAVVSCNCRSKGECCLGGRYNSKNVVYQACISPWNIIMISRWSI